MEVDTDSRKLKKMSGALSLLCLELLILCTFISVFQTFLKLQTKVRNTFSTAAYHKHIHIHRPEHDIYIHIYI